MAKAAVKVGRKPPTVTSDLVEEPLNCWRCGSLLAEAAGPGTRIGCRRCGAKTLVPLTGAPAEE